MQDHRNGHRCYGHRLSMHEKCAHRQGLHCRGVGLPFAVLHPAGQDHKACGAETGERRVIAFMFRFALQTRSYHSGNSISSFIFTNPYFSYNGRPISVASNEIAEIPLLLVSLISISNVL